MRVLHVVSLISPQGEYGGPTRVAVNDCKALRGRGHDARILAGTWGFTRVPQQIDGVPVHLFPARSYVPGGSFRGLAAPTMIPRLTSLVGGADVLHVHLARDLVTLPAAEMARRGGTPYVLQPHGMVVESSHPLSTPLDLLLTRQVLRGAGRVFYLTNADHDGVQAVGGTLPMELLRNGIEIPEIDWEERAARPAARARVLFLARVQEVKRPLDFVAMAELLAPEFPEVEFVMVGPDGGLGAEVAQQITASGLGDRLRWVGPVAPEETAEQMTAADIYVLPSVLDHYPMSVLEAMAHGLPVVMTETCGLSGIVRRGGAGRVVKAGAAGVAGGVRELLSDQGLRLAAARAAQQAAASELGMGPVVDQLERVYSDVITTTSSKDIAR